IRRGCYYSAKVIFSRLNIKGSFDYATDDARSIQKMIDGEADAYIISNHKVFQLGRNIKNEDRALHLIPVPAIAGYRTCGCLRHLPMRRLGPHCLVVAMKRVNARGASGVGHQRWKTIAPSRCPIRATSLAGQADPIGEACKLAGIGEARGR